MTETLDVVIIGAGFAGLGAAIKLEEAGRDDFVILDDGLEVGGTWRDNTYPGAACDIPSHLYSYSFDLNPDWSFAYAKGEEIQRYIVAVSHRHGLRPHLRLGRRVREARWSEDDKRWEVTTESGETYRARICIAGVGGLRDPAYPAIEGRERFAGPSMHSARWDHDVDLANKRVGVIGTGASAIQVVPAIAPEASEVVLFQRTPPWVFPRWDRSYGPLRKRLYRHLPWLQRLHRAAIYGRAESRFVFFGPLGEKLSPPIQRLAERFVASQVRDPDKRDKLIPDYRMGCKRMLISDDYYQALDRDDVSLETTDIARIVPEGIELTDGRRIELDALIYCTGFQVDRPLGKLQVFGRGGVDLAEAWGARPSAYLGMTVPDFPNLFILVGPNAGLGHNSIIFMIEAQLRYVMDAIAQLDELETVDLSPEALTAFEDEVDRRSRRMVWSTGCESWYLGKDGVNYTLWPGSTVEFWLRTRRFDRACYRTEPRRLTAARARGPRPRPGPRAAPRR